MNDTQVKKNSPVLNFLKRLKNARETSLVLIIVVMCIVLSITNPYFAKWANIQTLLGSIAINGIMTIGMIIVMISGGLDLSIGAVMCMSMAFSAKAITAGGVASAGHPYRPGSCRGVWLCNRLYCYQA